MAHPPALGLSLCGGCAPTPPRPHPDGAPSVRPLAPCGREGGGRERAAPINPRASPRVTPHVPGLAPGALCVPQGAEAWRGRNSRLPAEQAGGTAFVASSSSDGASASARPTPQRKPHTRRAIGQDHSERNYATSTSMKEGQNLSYVTKMGAYGFAVVAAFAVALAVLLSVSSTPAEAEIQSRSEHRRHVQTNRRKQCGPGQQRRHRLHPERGDRFRPVRDQHHRVLPQRRSRTRTRPRTASPSTCVRPPTAATCDVNTVRAVVHGRTEDRRRLRQGRSIFVKQTQLSWRRYDHDRRRSGSTSRRCRPRCR